MQHALNSTLTRRTYVSVDCRRQCTVAVGKQADAFATLFAPEAALDRFRGFVNFPRWVRPCCYEVAFDQVAQYLLVFPLYSDQVRTDEGDDRTKHRPCNDMEAPQGSELYLKQRIICGVQVFTRCATCGRQRVDWSRDEVDVYVCTVTFESTT